MKHRYLPMTEQDQKEMLASIGVEKVEELFSDIPESVRFKGEYKIKPAKSESALMKELSNLASKNADLKAIYFFFRCRCIRSLSTDYCGSCHFSFGILHSLYAISTGNFSRGITSYF